MTAERRSVMIVSLLVFVGSTNPTWQSIILMCGVSILACRDATSGARSDAAPNFLVAADTGPGGCDARQCHFRSTGDGASLNWFDPGASVAQSDTGGGGGGGGVIRFGGVSVSRGTSSSPNQTQTFLFFTVTECDASFGFCNTVRGGQGTIPNEDLRVGAQTVELHTNTSTNPSFFTYAGPTGQVDVVWKINGVFVQRFNGTQERSQPGFIEHDVGQATTKSAPGTGSIVGMSIFPANDGQVSSNRSMTITINH